MKYLVLIFSILSLSLSAQNAAPSKAPAGTTVGSNKTSTVIPKDTTYPTPVDMAYDTVQIYGILVDLKTPLGVSSYVAITKSWVYADGAKRAGEQWLETGEGVKINNWQRKLLWWILKNEW